MGRYDGRTAIVTGSRRGVGRIITDHLLEGGATVIGFARGESANGHPAYHHVQVDITDSPALTDAFVGIRREFTTVDILVNNAATLTSQYSMIMSTDVAREMVETNLLAPFVMSRECARLMKRSKWGRIINIGSMATSLEPAGDSVYAACKTGLTTLGNVMAREFASFNVTCNTLAITAIETDMLNQLPKDRIDAIIATLPVPRYATAEDITNVIDFFASESSSYITAQTVFLGGVN